MDLGGWVVIHLQCSLGSVTIYDFVMCAGTMIQSMAWNDTHNMLAALADGRFTVWYYPNCVYVDKDLLGRTIFSKDSRFVSTQL